jgi:hypothetical protein
MIRVRPHLEQLAGASRWTYRASQDSATEAAAWSAIALASYGEIDAARGPADWLALQQQGDGSVGVFADDQEPRWPTSLALLAWLLVDRAADSRRYLAAIDDAVVWCLNDRGKTAPRSEEIGHDTTIVGWSWAADTACWLEPTCYHVMALTTAGLGDQARVADGRRLIVDRLLPSGGANYGNTIVLGQQLLAHVAPTGVALTALSQQTAGDERIERSLAYLERALGPGIAPLSLSWACLGLTAFDRRPPHADRWIRQALTSDAWQPLAAFEQALLLLAARPALDWLPTAHLAMPAEQDIPAGAAS